MDAFSSVFDFIQSADQSLFLFLNGLYCTFLDPVMFWGSKSLLWTPFFLFLFFLVTRRWGWNTIWILIFAALMITVSDQLANLFKEGIERLRPSHEPGLVNVHLVNGYTGGKYGFYSAHASTTMATALYLIQLLHKKYRCIIPVVVCWSVFMSFTRIYLGVHYPGDILMGWMMGSLIGWGSGWVCSKAIRRYPISIPNKDQRKNPA